MAIPALKSHDALFLGSQNPVSCHLIKALMTFLLTSGRAFCHPPHPPHCQHVRPCGDSLSLSLDLEEEWEGDSHGRGQPYDSHLAAPLWGLLVSPGLLHLGGGVQRGILPTRRLGCSSLGLFIH